MLGSEDVRVELGKLALGKPNTLQAGASCWHMGLNREIDTDGIEKTVLRKTRHYEYHRYSN